MQINNAILYDFIHCPYKAYKINKQQRGTITDDQILYNQLKQTQKINFEKKLYDTIKTIPSNATFDNAMLKEVGTRVNLNFKNLTTDLALDGIEFTGKKNVIPIFITPFEKVTKLDKLFIALQAAFVRNEFNLQVDNCKIVFGKYFQEIKLKLSSFTKNIEKTINDLHKTLSDSGEPILILNKHCPVCEYSSYCKQKALAEGNISLLDRATSKSIAKYKQKGIFTIQQLSYLYKPRRREKQLAKPLISHNIEIQALAIRTDKIYVQKLPELSRQSVELFLDIEGNPDQEIYYLIGVILSRDFTITSHSYWANNVTNESNIWQQFIFMINEHPDAPIYHYGNYELKAINVLGKRYGTNVTHIESRLINIVNSIYGKIYFPVYSNRLIEL